jgi:hypothetical protein
MVTKLSKTWTPIAANKNIGNLVGNLTLDSVGFVWPRKG